MGELSILVLTNKSMPTKVDVLRKYYLLFQFYFFHYLVILDYPILDSDTDVNIGNVWQIQANLWKFLILNITHFPDLTFQNCFGEAIYQ